MWNYFMDDELSSKDSSYSAFTLGRKSLNMLSDLSSDVFWYVSWCESTHTHVR